jgi:hypothetical protein
MLSSALRTAAVRGKTVLTASSATTHVFRRTMAGNASSTTSSVSFLLALKIRSNDTCDLYAKFFADILREIPSLFPLVMLAVCS